VIARPLLRGVLLLSVVVFLIVAAGSVRAAPSINVQGYRINGSFTFTDGSTPIPVGAELEIRVWMDLGACAFVVDWGDGSPLESSTGTGFAESFYHTYAADGTYTITVTEDVCPGTSVSTETIIVGGSFLGLDPFVVSYIGFLGGIFAIGIANGNPTQKRGGGLLAATPRGPGGNVGPGVVPPPGGPQPQAPRRVFQTGIPPSKASHWISLREIPLGAPRQEPPRIPIVPLTPTDVSATSPCQGCSQPLGYTVAGWFCRNPTCQLLQPGNRTAFPQVGQGYGSHFP